MKTLTKAIYHVYQQLPMKPLGPVEDVNTEWKSQLKHLGEVEAFTGPHAIEQARDKFKYDFRFGKKLGKFPIVERTEVNPSNLYH